MGSGRRTKENFGRGLRRVIGAYLCEVTAVTLSSECSVPVLAAQQAVSMLKEWAATDGNEEVWTVPESLCFVARWGAWRRDWKGE